LIKGLHSEALRKGIHLTTIGIPLAIWFLPRATWKWPLVIFTVLTIAVDMMRLGHPAFGLFFRRILGRVLRDHEKQDLMGSTYLAVSILLSALILPREIAVAVMGYMILGDGLAGLVGKTWGRINLAFGKSLEGTLTGFLANLLVGWLVFREVEPMLLGACVASASEFLPMPLDDNFAIPLVAGLALWLGLY
jgi:dolichol kinase